MFEYNKNTESEFVTIEIPNMSRADIFWLEYNAVRRDLFGIVQRELTNNIPWQNLRGDFFQLIDDVGEQLVSVWERIKTHYGVDNQKVRRLSGAYYEAIFYFSVLRTAIVFREAQQLIHNGMGNQFPGEPPYLVILPIFEVIPRLFWYKEEGGQERRYAPQVRADFVTFRREPDDTVIISLVDVKRSEPKDAYKWEVCAVGLAGAIFEIAFPKAGITDPLKMEDWERRIVCLECGKWPIEDGQCVHCGKKWV